MPPDTCQPHSSLSTRACGRWWIAHLLVGLLLTVNLAVFVLRNAVALPCSDQWELHQPVWAGASAWQLFTHQHGPHRQGVFFPPTAAILRATDGDVRIESLWIAAWLLVAAGLAWTLPRRLTGRWSWADALPLFWCLSLLQYETITLTPNLSHSIGPLALVLGAAHALLCRRPWLRWTLVGLLGGAAVFTGFGLFASAVLTALALGVILRCPAERLPATLALALLAAAWVRFFHGYVFAPAAPGFAFPHHPLSDYIPFLTGMAGAPHGFTGPTLPGQLLGAGLLCAGAGILLKAAWQLVRAPNNRPSDRLALLLAGGALLFMANTAVGRVQLGADAGMAPRYLSLMVPLSLALYLAVRDHPGRALRWAGTGALAALTLWPFRDLAASPACGTWGMPIVAQASAIQQRDGKQAWTWLYSRTGDAAQATARSRYQPLPHAAENLPERLEHLRRLGWFPFTADGSIRPVGPFLPASPVVPVAFHGPERAGRWMGEEAFLLVAPGQTGWIDLELLSRAGGLPAQAPLVVEFRGRRFQLNLGHGPAAISLPLDGGPAQVVRLHSPAGTARPSDSGASADSRDLSFFLAHASVGPTPRYLPLGPADDASWALRAAIVALEGFHGWETGFGWMAETLTITTSGTASATLEIVVGNRFAPLPGSGGLTLRVDDAPARPLIVSPKGRTTFSVPLGPGAHSVSLHSVDGALSPRQAGHSTDDRPLSYALHSITCTPAP